LFDSVYADCRSGSAAGWLLQLSSYRECLPYALYYQEYQSAPPWIFLSERKAPAYRHSELANAWGHEVEALREARSNLLANVRGVRDVASFYGSPLLLFPLTVATLLLASYRFWAAAVIYLVVWCGLLVSLIKFPHYIAASIGLLPILAAYGFRVLSVIGRNYGSFLVLAFATLLCIQGNGERVHVWETRARNFISPRMIGTTEALKQGGRHLILVRYSVQDVGNNEVVYNGADIDSSQIVWARDMGESKNRELINYYHGSRKISLYEPDIDPAKLIPYASASQ
jgi:hypothetical protein